MLRFADYINQDSIESIIAEGVMDHMPLDAEWVPSLSTDSSSFEYKFNVKGDDCDGLGKRKKCYTLHLDGTPEYEVSISFDRAGSHSDIQKNYGMDVFKGVLKGLGEYITAKKPAKLDWSAVKKSSAVNKPGTQLHGKIINCDARANIYDGWAIRHLFPDKYVGVCGEWIRRDIYDSKYVTIGFPPIEDVDGSSLPGSKAKAYEALKEKTKANKKEIERLERERQEEERRRREEEEERERQEEQRRRIEALRVLIDDRTQNPNAIALNDIVYLEKPNFDTQDHHYANHIGVVKDFRNGRYYYRRDEENPELYAEVQFAGDGDSDPANNDPEHPENFDGTEAWIKVSELKKEHPQGNRERRDRFKSKLDAIINNTEYNPNKLQVGDDVVSFMKPDNVEQPWSTHNELFGKLKEFVIQHPGSIIVDWDEHAQEILGWRHTRSLSAKMIYKRTPEVMKMIADAKRTHEIDQEIEKNKKRGSGNKFLDADKVGYANRDPEQLQALINDPKNNGNLKPGDHVVVMNDWRHRDKKGTVVSLEKGHWDEAEVYAYVRFHNSRASSPSYIATRNLKIDDSPEATARIARVQAQQTRQQNITANAGGHNIGDSVVVVNGIHRGKTGRIVSFRSSGNTVSAVVAQMSGPNFVTRVNSLQPPANSVPQPAAENFSFRSHLAFFESRLAA